MVHIKIDNVAQYCYELFGSTQFDVSKHIQNIMPPFDLCSFHYMVNVHVDGSKFRNKLPAKIPSEVEISSIKDTDNIIVSARAYNGYERLYLGEVRFNIDSNGYLIDVMEVPYYSPTPRLYEAAKYAMEMYGQSENDFMIDCYKEFISQCTPVLMSISFMHCKNVHLIDEPLTRQRRRKLERKGGIRYKVLDIEPFKKQVRRETQPGESQLQRALHICRGHFATYTEEKPLFGKLVGTYWKPMHVRGNKTQGQVVKDYNIVLDENQEA